MTINAEKRENENGSHTKKKRHKKHISYNNIITNHYHHHHMTKMKRNWIELHCIALTKVITELTKVYLRSQRWWWDCDREKTKKEGLNWLWSLSLLSIYIRVATNSERKKRVAAREWIKMVMMRWETERRNQKCETDNRERERRL